MPVAYQTQVYNDEVCSFAISSSPSIADIYDPLDPFSICSGSTSTSSIVAPFNCSNLQILHALDVKDVPDLWSNQAKYRWGQEVDTLQATNELTENVKELIGENGVDRYYEFREKYHDGWDNGRGKKLSTHSTAMLIYFVSNLKNITISTPSIFLTHNGNLQLCWEDGRKGEIEIEFFHDRFEYYIEANSEEDVISKHNIENFISMLTD